MSTTGAQLGSTCGFSTRLSLRWVPEIPEETTDTIVLSVGEWFVDLRMDIKSGNIDWAMAGTRIEENPKEIPLKVLFTRELDSLNEIGIVDVGNFSPQSDGTDLETGEMPRADLPGAPMTTFEEVWRELPFREGPEGAKKGISWILESDDAPLTPGEQSGQATVTKVFLGRIWGTYLAFQQTQTHSSEKDESGAWSVKRVGGEVSARREEWSSGWKEKYVVGPDADAVPSIKNGFEGEGTGSWRIPGEKVIIQGRSFITRAFEEIH
ncbi:uncharacterized protein N7511_006251 [Penicillium nucicola]|uniref:uncharacterized protein n=1 Tax=Penicillium nucicola TaxID=1850975 RepID=UPI002544D5C9|nr:uncharacterized protein N7511_006251 [Penicillium nucicola]KAJ5757557.1 hypothetical protein N7511_006251 [Penicillium nucicola]